MTCQSCGAECVGFLDLGSQPICNAFLKSVADFKQERFYPLKLVFCPACTLVQLDSVLPNSLVFGSDYNYLSGTTPDIVTYFKNLAQILVRRFDLKRGDCVVEAGSNDGTFLKNFVEYGINVIGVDPAPKPAKIASDNGVETINKPFENSISDIERRLKGRLRLVVGLNVLAHTDQVHAFLEGVNRLCGRGDVTFISQSHYLPNLIQEGEWDTVYHEHARFYTVTSLGNLLSRHGLNQYDTEKVHFYGGSFLSYASVVSGLNATPNLLKMKREESDYGNLKLYERFQHTVEQDRESLQNCLTEIKLAKKTIVGVGAPMKSSTLLNFCDIGSNQLDYITEVNPLKIGMYSPGVRIPVVEESRLFSDQPDYVLILSWNVAERIIKNLRSKGYKGKFIIPVPSVKVVDPL